MDKINEKVETIISPQPFWKKRQFLYPFFLISAIVVILLSRKLIYLPGYQSPSQKIQQQPSFEAKQIPINQEIDSTVANKTKNSLTLKGGSRELTYNITDSTIIYKCTDFNDIKTCTKDGSGLKKDTPVRILTVKLNILYVLYK